MEGTGWAIFLAKIIFFHLQFGKILFLATCWNFFTHGSPCTISFSAVQEFVQEFGPPSLAVQ